MNGLREAGLECATPEGAFYAFPDVRKLSKDSRQSLRHAAGKAHVATIPGVVFGAQGEGHVRFSYSVPKETISLGLEALNEFMLRRSRKK